MYRNHALAALFGASALSDVYFAAFQIPDTVYRLLVFGAISASFVPLFLTLKKRDPSAAWDFVQSVLNGFLVVVFVICGVLFAFSHEFVSLIYRDFSSEMQSQTAEIMRLMLLCPILFTFSSVFAGIQNAARTFWGFALAPLVYNGGIIFGILVLAPSMGIYGVTYGVIIGAALHAFVQLIPAIKLGWTWRPVLHWSREFRQLLLAAFPRVLSMAGSQLNFFIEGIIATTVSIGNLTVLRYAQDIQSFPIGIIGVSIAISSFSVLSQFALDEDHHNFSRYFREKLSHILLLLLPAAGGIFVLREALVAFVLEGGLYGAEATLATENTLAALAFGIIGMAILPLVNRAFFAYHDTVRPLIVTVLSVALNTGLAIWLSKYMNVIGIGLASTISTTFAVILSIILLNQFHPQKGSLIPWKAFFSSILSTAVMVGMLLELMKLFELSSSSIILLIQMLAITIVGVAIYFISLHLCSKELSKDLLKNVGR